MDAKHRCLGDVYIALHAALLVETWKKCFHTFIVFGVKNKVWYIDSNVICVIETQSAKHRQSVKKVLRKGNQHIVLVSKGRKVERSKIS